MREPLQTDVANSILAAVRKRRILLVDTSRAKRDMRSEAIRKLGAEVDCAADVIEARSWWRPDLYDLVLIGANAIKSETDKFCDDMRRLNSGQKIRFLVGKPEYLAHSQDEDKTPTGSKPEDESSLYQQSATPLGGNGLSSSQQRWGILEACHRISAVRSALNARTRAMRDRPLPPRDSELQGNHRANRSDRLSELLREEIAKEEIAKDTQ